MDMTVISNPKLYLGEYNKKNSDNKLKKIFNNKICFKTLYKKFQQ